MNVSRTHLVLLAAVTLWCLFIVAPLLAGRGAPADAGPVSRLADRLGSAVCHQLDARSLHLAGIKFAVCARCTGIYTGFALAVLAAAFVTVRVQGRHRPAWVLAVSPMLLDVILDAAGLRPATLVSRVLTGAVFGAGAGLLLVPHLLEGFRQLLARPPLPILRRRHELNA